MTPLVTVMIRSMDRSCLARALDSVARQDHANIEIVVVAANGAAHAPMPAQWGGRVVRFVQPASPLQRAAAANAALAAARGEYLNFLDDDDELLPDHVGTMLAALSARPAARLAFGLQEVVDDAGKRIAVFGLAGPSRPPFTRLALFDDSCFGIHAALFHRSLVDEGTRFDEAFAASADHDFWLQCACRTRFLPVARITTRWHGEAGTSGGGWSSNWDPVRMQAARTQMRAKWAASRRAYLATAAGQMDATRMSVYADAPRIALRVAERLVARLPADPNALQLAAVANARAGQKQRARQLLAQASRHAPGHPALAALAVRFGDDEAIEAG